MTTLTDYAQTQWPVIAASVSPSTAGAYDRGLRLRVLPSLGNLPVAAITPSQIEVAYASWSGTYSTRADALAVLSRIMRRAVRDGLRTSNPVRDIEKPRVRSMKPLPKAMTQAQLSRLFAVVPDHYHLAFGLMTYAGLRFGEMAGVMAGDVDLAGRMLTVARQLTRSGQLAPTKGGRPRVVPLRPELVRLLPKNLHDLPPSEFLCETPTGALLHGSNLTRDIKWRAIRDQIRPGLRLHDLRHHAATSFLADGVPLNSVQAFLGHSNESVTSRDFTAGAMEARAALPMLDKGLAPETTQGPDPIAKIRPLSGSGGGTRSPDLTIMSRAL